MTETKVKFATLTILVILTVSAIYLYLLYFADDLSNRTNYFVGLVVVPVIFGAVLGVVGAIFHSRKEGADVRKYFYFPLVCGLASVIPTGYVLLMMTLGAK